MSFMESELTSSPPSSPLPQASSGRAATHLRPSVDFSSLPPIFILPTHLSSDELDSLEERLLDHCATLTYDIKEAKIIFGKVATKKRIELELRSRRLWTKEQQPEQPRKRAKKTSPAPSRGTHAADDSDSTTEIERFSQTFTRGEKRKGTSLPSFDVVPKGISDAIVIHDSSTESEDQRWPDEPKRSSVKRKISSSPAKNVDRVDSESSGLRDANSDIVRVVRLQWLEDSMNQGTILPISDYLVYQGKSTPRPEPESIPQPPSKMVKSLPKPRNDTLASPSPGQSILERAKADVSAKHTQAGLSSFLPAPHGERRFRDQGRWHKGQAPEPYRRGDKHLLAHTTSELEGTDSDIPPPPEWVKKRLKYACQRVTLAHPPNEAFTDELEKIKLARLLTNDEIGVRAYSTSIAALRAYPFKIVSPREILRLPGCDVKIANLWIEWKNMGHIKAARDAESDEALTILRDFYNIWGVGAHTAREFHLDRGWKDRDDIVEYGWTTLSRVQQIGVKYYTEFQRGIPRVEVEAIAATVHTHAVRVRDQGIELLVVGGHRRGKPESGDVDMIVSHRRLDATAGLVTDIVASLEDAGYVTHTLLLALTSTDRKQATLPFKAVGVASHGAGFDTLDKALVVWQDPSWPTQAADLARDPTAKNPAPHRRVDIIVSPWRTVGCAVYGWSGGTTFQRDTRRYSKNVKGWKFDSSGIRDRRSGEVVRLEGEHGVSGSMVDAEKAVFAGLGLEYREPWERCTG